MEFKFYYPLKDKNISPFKKAKAEISIPAKLLENILTNRQKKLKNNKSFDKSKGSFKHISITDSSSASKSKKMYSKLQLSSDKDRNIISKQSLIEENKKLKIENAQLKNKIKSF